MSSGIGTKISITDGMSAPLRSMYTGITELVTGLKSVKAEGKGAFDGSVFNTASNHMLSAVAQLKTYEDELNRAKRSVASWQNLGFIQQFDTSGMQRAQQELNAANAAYDKIVQTQGRLTSAALGMRFLPSNAVGDINTLNTRIVNLRKSFDTMSQQQSRIGKFNTAGLSQFSANTENIRRQMARIELLQEEINRAVRDNDISKVNLGYKELAGLVDNVEADINSNTAAQKNFNSALSTGVNRAKDMAGSIKYYVGAAAAAIGGVKFTQSVDEYVNASSRLGLITENENQQKLLQSAVYKSASEARGKFNDSMSNVAKLGLLAGDAFGSNNEIVLFDNLMSKSFKISGADTQSREAGMYQLIQAMASGKLQGDEFRSIMENAPMLAQTIADYTGKSKGELKEMSKDGTITSDIIKNALFAAADEINAKFDTMPRTFGDIGNQLVNDMQYKTATLKAQVSDILNGDIGQSAIGTIGSGIDWGIMRIQEFIDRFKRTKDIAGDNLNGIIGDFSNLANAIAGPNGEAQRFLATVQRIAASTGTREGLQRIGGIVTTVAKGFNAAAGAVASLNQKFSGFLPTVITLAVAYKTFQFTHGLLLSPINSMLGLIDSSVQRYNNLAAAMGGVTQATTLMNAAMNATKWLTIAGGVMSVVAALGSLVIGLQTSAEAKKLSEETASGYTAEQLRRARESGMDPFTISQIDAAKKEYESQIENKEKEKQTYINTSDYSYLLESKYVMGKSWTEADEANLNRALKEYNKEVAAYDQNIEDLKKYMEDTEHDLYVQDAERKKSENDLKNLNTDFTNTDIYGKGDSGGDDGGNKDDIQKVEIVNTVDIASEDLRYMRDIAEREAINQFTSKFVQPVVNVQFGEVRETADVDAIVKKLTSDFVAELNTAGEFVHY